MSKKTSVYYSVANGGDGSAYPKFFLDERLARFHEDNEDEGFCESTGSLEIEHTGDISFPGVMTIDDLASDLPWHAGKFYVEELCVLIDEIIKTSSDSEEQDRLTGMKESLKKTKFEGDEEE